MKFAVIANNIVENIIVAESKEIAEEVVGKTCIEYTDDKPAFIGATYDSETGEFFKIIPIEETILEEQSENTL